MHTAASSSALAPRVWQSAVASGGRVALRRRAAPACTLGSMRVPRLAAPSAATAPPSPLSVLRRWASSSSGPFQKTATPPPTHELPRSASALSAAAPSTVTSEDAPGWVAGRKANGEQRMSISIRSSAQRQLARRPQSGPAAPSPESSPVLERADAGPDPLRNTRTDDRAPAHGLPAFHPRSVPPYSASSNHHHSQHDKNIKNTDTLTPTPPLSAGAASSSSPATREGRSKAALPADEERRRSPAAAAAVDQHSGASLSSCRPLHFMQGRDVAPPRADTSSADASPTSAGRSASHPLLYSVSRFTEPVKRIILIRNGRSEANDDVSAYVHTPDWRIPLVEEGKREAIAAGRALSELIGDDPVYFYYSPYIRSRQSLRYVLQGFDEARLSGRTPTREWWEEEDVSGTLGGVSTPGGSAAGSATPTPLDSSVVDLSGARPESSSHGAASALEPSATAPGSLHREPSLVLDSGTSSNIIGVREDVRLRDGDIGRYTSTDELMHHLTERELYGKFFYRFPFGESGADVCDRVTSFLDAFQRERVEFPMDTNVAIITHGLTMRMFIKRWFHLTVETFHRMRSPPSGSLCTLTRLHHRSCFRLDESCVESMHLPLSLNEFNGYKYRNKQLLGSMSSGAPYM